MDQKLLGLSLILAVVVGANGSRTAGLLLFLALAVAGRRMARKDPYFFVVLNQTRKQKSLYDPMKAGHV